MKSLGCRVKNLNVIQRPCLYRGVGHSHQDLVIQSLQKGSSILASRCCHRMLVFDDSRQVSNGVRVTEGGGYSHRYTVLAHSLLSEARFIKQVVYCICKTIILVSAGDKLPT